LILFLIDFRQPVEKRAAASTEGGAGRSRAARRSSSAARHLLRSRGARCRLSQALELIAQRRGDWRHQLRRDAHGLRLRCRCAP